MKTTFKCLLAIIAFVAGSFVAQAQVKIGTNATVPSPTSNLEVEGSVGGNISKVAVTKDSSKVGIGNIAPTNKLHVTAPANPVRFEGLQTGVSSYSSLVVDGNGVVKVLPSQAVVPTNVNVMLQLTNSPVILFSPNVLTYRNVPFNVEAEDNRNACSGNVFTAPEPGYYLINQTLSANYDGTGALNSYLYSSVLVAGVRYTAVGYGSDTSPLNGEGASSSLSVVVRLNTGDTVTPQYALISAGNVAGNQITLRGSGNQCFLTITKL